MEIEKIFFIKIIGENSINKTPTVYSHSYQPKKSHNGHRAEKKIKYLERL